MPVNQIGPPCPNCNCLITKVIKTYRDEHNNLVRRRSCISCSHRFYSAQLAEMLINPYDIQWDGSHGSIKWSNVKEPMLNHFHQSTNEA
jgi:transcriptional regulator NrdR family protein